MSMGSTDSAGARRLVRDAGGVQVLDGLSRPVLRYNFGDGVRPHIHPIHVAGTRGVLTRWRPWDHLWHYGLFTGMNDVNGLDFWCCEEQRFPAEQRGTIAHHRLVDTWEDATGVGLTAESHWTGPDVGALLVETQRLDAHAGPVSPRYTFDFTWTLRAAREVTFGAYPYGGLAARLAGEPRTLRWLTAEGGEEIPARDTQIASRWAAAANRIDWVSPFERPWRDDYAYAGLAILDHPSNRRHPTSWCGDRGCCFLNPTLVLHEPLSLPRDGELRLRYRIVVFQGLPDREALEQHWQEWSRE